MYDDNIPAGAGSASVRDDTRSRPSTPDLPQRLWTHQETADFLGIPCATLHDLNYKRTGPRSFKVGRHRRYDPRDVLAWLGERASDIDRDGSRSVVHNLSMTRPVRPSRS
jgi:predicted DNA-binding transcriptional regulator AlpA